MAKPNDVYHKIFFEKSRGHPLFTPEPDQNLPLELQAQGIAIGDFGIFSEDGSFDSLFNCYMSSCDSANRQGVPTGHEPVAPNPHYGGVSKRQYYSPGTVISGGKIKRTSVNASGNASVMSFGGGGSLLYEGFTNKWAVLVLPAGASRENLRNETPLRAYAQRNAIGAYDLLAAKGHSDKRLFVVTGFDKTLAWGLAVSSDSSVSGGLSLNFSATPAAGASASFSCEWKNHATAIVRTSPPHNTQINQTIFLRGFFLPKPSSLWRCRMVKYISTTQFPQILPPGEEGAPTSNALEDTPQFSQRSLGIRHLLNGTSIEGSASLSQLSSIYAFVTSPYNLIPSYDAVMTSAPAELEARLRRNGDNYFAIGERADVWQAELPWPSEDNRKVAVKVIRGISSDDLLKEEFKTRLAKYASIWKLLDHPNVAKFYGMVFGNLEMPVLIAQAVSNCSIMQYLEAHHDSPNCKLVLATEVAQGLQYLHEFINPIPHGSIRGSNVHINEEGHAILIDYGLTFITGPTEFSSARVMDSCRWTAPEILNPPDNSVGPDESGSFWLQSDIYSLGMTILEMYSGAAPFARKSESSVILSVLAGARPSLSPFLETGNIQLGTLVQKCWDQDPMKRPPAKAVCKALQTLCSSSAIRRVSTNTEPT